MVDDADTFCRGAALVGLCGGITLLLVFCDLLVLVIFDETSGVDLSAFEVATSLDGEAGGESPSKRSVFLFPGDFTFGTDDGGVLLKFLLIIPVLFFSGEEYVFWLK